MEKIVKDLMAEIRESFGLEEMDIRTYSPLTLAYVGDAVYELVIRSLLAGRGNAQVNRLHRKAPRIPPGTQCQFRYHGKARHHDRLPESYRF